MSDDVAKRIADLSPEKRELFELWLKEQGAEISLPEPAPENAAGARESCEKAELNLAIEDFSLPDFIRNNLTQLNPLADTIKLQTSQFYTTISDRLAVTGIGQYSTFLNYGYMPDNPAEPARITLPENQLNGNNIRLILQVVGECDLTDREVLDVGCGRGGTLATLAQYYQAKRLVGIDLTPAHIEFCQEHLQNVKMSFLVQDAEKLAFGPDMFDVVINIESACHYPDILRFYAEVARVLRTGGYFLYADIFNTACTQRNLSFLQQSGLAIESERDITHNVLLACDQAANRNLKALTAGQAHKLLGAFVSAPGSPTYEDLKSGRLTYRIYRLRKIGASER